MTEHMIYAPQLGESVRFLRVLEFLKKPGDHIKIDEPVIVVETDKASMEIESPVAGIIQDFRVALNADVPIGYALASILVEADHAVPNAASGPFPHDLSSSYVDHGLSEQQIALANRMRISSTQIIQSCLHTVCDSEPVSTIRKHYREFLSASVPSSTEIFVWCALKAMHQNPKFRSILREDGVTLRQFNHATVGVAVSMPDDDLTMLSISDKAHDSLLGFSKSYKHKLTETKLGKNHNGFHTLSISDLSAYDIQTAVPIIVSPAIATLCIGRVYGSSLNDRSYGLSLAFDHRIINGVGAANFLKTIKKELYALASKVTVSSDISYMVKEMQSSDAA